MTDNVEVKLGADVGPATSSMNTAADSIQKSLAEINNSINKFGATNAKVEAEILAENKSMAESFTQLKEKVAGSIEGAAALFEGFSHGLLMIGAVLAGGAIFKEAIHAVMELTGEVVKLQNVFGMASEEATTTSIALKLIGKSSDEYAGIALKLQKQIKTNGDAVREMGLEFNDAEGNLKPLNELTHDALDVLQEYKQGTDRNAAALYLFGRSAQEVYGFFKLNESVIERAKELQEAYGIEVGPEAQAQVKAYKMEQAALGIMFEAVQHKIGEALLPVLTELAGWFNDVGPTAIHVFDVGLKGIMTVIDEFAMIVKIAITTIIGFFDNLVTDIKMAGAVLREFIEGNYSAIPKIIEQRNEIIRRNNEVVAEQIQETWEHTTDKIGKLWGDLAKGPSEGAPKGGSKTFTDPKAGKEDKSRISEFEAELAAKRDAFERMKLDQGSFEQFSQASESTYWKNILDTVNLSEKERAEVLKKYYEVERKIRIDAFQREIADLNAQAAQYRNNIEARIGIAEQEYKLIAQRFGDQSKEAQLAYGKIAAERRQLAEQIRKVADIEEKDYQQHLLHQLEMDKMSVDQSLALQEISKTQALAAEADLENKRTAIQRQGLNARLAAAEADPDRNPELIANINAQIEALEDQHQKIITKLRDEAAKEAAKYQIEAVDSAKSSFATFFEDINKGTMSLKDAFNKMATSIVNDLQKIAAKQLTEQLFGGGSQGGGMLSGIMGMIMGGGGGVAAFAEGTPYVPKTQLAVVHQGEAIVPAQYNKGGGANNISINVDGGGNGMNYATQSQLAMQIGNQVDRALKRNG